MNRGPVLLSLDVIIENRHLTDRPILVAVGVVEILRHVPLRTIAQAHAKVEGFRAKLLQGRAFAVGQALMTVIAVAGRPPFKDTKFSIRNRQAPAPFCLCSLAARGDESYGRTKVVRRRDCHELHVKSEVSRQALGRLSWGHRGYAGWQPQRHVHISSDRVSRRWAGFFADHEIRRGRRNELHRGNSLCVRHLSSGRVQ